MQFHAMLNVGSLTKPNENAITKNNLTHVLTWLGYVESTPRGWNQNYH